MEVGQGFSVLTCRSDLALGGDKNCGITQLKIELESMEFDCILNLDNKIITTLLSEFFSSVFFVCLFLMWQC